MMLYRQEFFVSELPELSKEPQCDSVPPCDNFLKDLQGGKYPALSVVEHTKDLEDLYPKVLDFKNRFSAFLFLGTGGSSLGPQTLYALRYPGMGLPQPLPHLYFLDNIDPCTFEYLWKNLDLKTTGVVAISKSGTTAETLFQLHLCLERWASVVGEASLKDYFMVLTEERSSPVSRLSKRYGLPFISHPCSVGGRFSIFSPVGALAAFLGGVDFWKIREGGAEILKAPQEALKGAHAQFLLKEKGITQTVLMPYRDSLGPLALWFRQLWAESLGKNGQGTTPIRALGTVDQHSQTQLYLEGPPDKFFTFVKTAMPENGHVIFPEDPETSYLRGKSMGALLDAECQATITAFQEKNLPLRVFSLKDLEEKALGALLMHFMIETLFMAELLGVDALTQPAVERGKVLTRLYLEHARPPSPQ